MCFLTNPAVLHSEPSCRYASFLIYYISNPLFCPAVDIQSSTFLTVHCRCHSMFIIQVCPDRTSRFPHRPNAYVMLHRCTTVPLHVLLFLQCYSSGPSLRTAVLILCCVAALEPHSAPAEMCCISPATRGTPMTSM